MKPVTRTKSVEVVAQVARALEELVDDVVFVGGSVAALLITDESIVTVRPTLDVDVIVEVAGLPEYYKFERKLKRKGFAPVPDGPVCRYSLGGVIVDVMPDDEEILGFSNRWYRSAIETAESRMVDGIEIRVVSVPLFLATKLEAYHGRGGSDYLGSHDMEDILAVVDGRPSLIGDCVAAPEDVKAYLRDEFTRLLNDDEFNNVLPGLVDLTGGAERGTVIRDRLQGLIRSLG